MSKSLNHIIEDAYGTGERNKSSITLVVNYLLVDALIKPPYTGNL